MWHSSEVKKRETGSEEEGEEDTIIMTGKVGDVRQAVSNDASWIQVSTLSWILQGKQRIRAIVM